MMTKTLSLVILGVLVSFLAFSVFASNQALAANNYEKINLTRQNIEDVLNSAKTWVSTIVGIVGVIIIIVAAIRYMMAGGDEEKVASAKKTLVGGVIGVALAIIAWGIFGLVVSFLRG